MKKKGFPFLKKFFRPSGKFSRGIRLFLNFLSIFFKHILLRKSLFHYIPAVVFFMGLINSVLGQATFNSSTTGNWNSAGSWTIMAGFDADGIPDADDIVVILNNFDITVTVNAACAQLTINGNANNQTTLLTVNSSTTLTIGGAFDIHGGTGNRAAGLTNNGTIEFASTVSFGPTNNTTYTIGANCTFVYNGTIAQTVVAIPGKNYVNLTLSGSGAKTTTGITIDGILSMEGTATTTGTVATYGVAATLQYKGTGAQTTGIEFPATWSGTGGVIIANISGNAVTLAADKIVNAPLTINNNSTLNTSVANNYALTFSGNLVNNGTFIANASAITISGAATQSIAGFTTTGTVSMTKTGGTATLNGNVNGGALTINGAGGTLNLGTGLTHTFTSTWTRTAGTLNGGSSLLKIGGSVSGAGGTFTAGTGAVEWNAAGAQTTAAVAYNNLIFSGNGAKSIATGTSVTGNLSISGASASIGAGLNISVGSLTLGGLKKINGTWGSTTSSATHKDNTYFAATTGYLTVTNDTRPTPTFSGLTPSQSICYGTATISLSGTVSATGPIYPANSEIVGVTINGSTQNATISGGAGGFSINFPTSTIPASGTPYTITYSYTGDDNLTAAANNTNTALTVNSLPTPSFTAQPGASACIGVNVTYTTQGSMTSYVWGFPGVLNTDYSITSGGAGTNSTVTLKYLTTGSKTVTINYTDGNGCTAASATSSTATTVNPMPINNYNVSNPEVCKSYGADINVSGSQAGLNYEYLLRYNSDNSPYNGIPVNGFGLPFDFTNVIVPSTTEFNILATNTTTGCSVQLTNHSIVTVLSFDASVWNVTGLSDPDSFNLHPVSRPDICPELISPDFNPDNSDYKIGTTSVVFRIDRDFSTYNWSFFFDVSGDNVIVSDTIISGNDSPTVAGNYVNAKNSDQVFLRFKIDNVAGDSDPIIVNFSISGGKDTFDCGDEDPFNNVASQTIDPMPAVGPFN